MKLAMRVMSLEAKETGSCTAYAWL